MKQAGADIDKAYQNLEWRTFGQKKTYTSSEKLRARHMHLSYIYVGWSSRRIENSWRWRDCHEETYRTIQKVEG